MREQIINVLNNWMHTSPQKEQAEEKEKDLKSVINNKMIPYSYVNYIYQEKNWECPICEVDNDHCEHLHCMICQRLHPKD